MPNLIVANSVNRTTSINAQLSKLREKGVVQKKNMDSLLQPVLFYENFIAPAIRVINPSFRTIININKKSQREKMKIARVFCILPILLLMISCGGHTDYERLQDTINRYKTESRNHTNQGYVANFEILTDIAYLHPYRDENKTRYAASCQQIIQVPQDVSKLPETLQAILLSCRYKGWIYQFQCDAFWGNKYPDSVLYACLDDKGSMRVFYIKHKS